MFGVWTFFMIGVKVIFILALSSSAFFAQDSATENFRPVIGVILPFSSAFEDIAIEQQRAIILAEPEYTNGLVYTYHSYNTDHEFSAIFRGKYGSNPGFFWVEDMRDHLAE